MTKVFLDGHIDVPEDRLEAVEAALPIHIALTRAEPGCLSFNVEACPTISGRFLVSEVFVDQASFDAHQQRTKTSNWFTVTQGIARDYTVRSSET
ncbi:antibiotic biosynthesis monooxygenase [Agrobacterium vitis]|uniref:putative quinol monooxygenase n=1 Tax=Agrobacterium vitis TaxID=373 RepID=UPI0012E77579|nr:putative quinol monooxygenase [Agrobacterium vitis]MVA82063.1 antibiotic biosynthesis monooxygenase [Agrobacterium vitis]